MDPKKPVKLDIAEGALGTRFVESKNQDEGIGVPDDGFSTSVVVNQLQEADSAIAHLNINLTAEYEAPDPKVALEYRKQHHPRRLDKSLIPLATPTGVYGAGICPNCTSESLGCWCFKDTTLRRFGSGISNYFKWLKFVGTMMFLLGISSIPALVFNIYGGTFFNDDGVPIASSTLGNLYNKNESIIFELSTASNVSDFDLSNYTTDKINLRLDYLCDTAFEGYCEVDRDKLLFFYAAIDAIGMIILWLAIDVAGKYIKREDTLYKQKLLKVEDYSIEVRNIPADCTAKQLEEHFNKILDGSSIYDVQIVESTGNKIELCVKRGRLMKKLARQDGIIRRLNTKPNVNEARVAKEKAKFQKLREQIENIDRKAASHSKLGVALLAYVTFETQEARERCLEAYGRLHFCGQPAKLRLDSTHKIAVNPAPAPSTLLWENADYSVGERRMRSCVALFFLILVLVCTATISYVSDDYLLFSDFTDIANDVDVICDGAYTNVNVTEAISLALTEYNDTEFGIDCLCDNEILLKNALFPESKPIFFAPDGVCEDYFLARSIGIGIGVGVSFVVLLFNALINAIIFFTASFMKFQSLVERESTTLKLVFFVTFVNTGLIVLLVNSDVETLLGIEFPFGSIIGSGPFTDFEALWYQKVGLEVLFVTSLNVFAPHVAPLLNAGIESLKRKYKKPVSQAEMNDMFLGPEFILSFRYAQILMMMFLILMYSSGLPALYFIGFCYMIVTYYVDKYLFLRVCRTPPRYTVRLGQWANSALEWAIYLHLGIGMWMYSSPLLFPEDSNDLQASIVSNVGKAWDIPIQDIITENAKNISGEINVDFEVLASLQDRVFKNQALPMFLVLMLMLASKVFIVADLFFTFLKKLKKQAGKCFDRFFGKDPLEYMDHVMGYDEEDYALNFQRAIERGEIDGITSYNILANPIYAHAFQLSNDEGVEAFKSLEQALRVHRRFSNTSSGSHSSGRSKSTLKSAFSKITKRSKKSKKSKEDGKSVSSDSNSTSDKSIAPLQSNSSLPAEIVEENEEEDISIPLMSNVEEETVSMTELNEVQDKISITNDVPNVSMTELNEVQDESSITNNEDENSKDNKSDESDDLPQNQAEVDLEIGSNGKE